MRLVSMDLAPASLTCGQQRLTAGGQPIVDYEAKYPSANCANGTNLGAAVWAAEGKAGLPILNMLNGTAIVHTEIDGLVAGPNADGSFGEHLPAGARASATRRCPTASSPSATSLPCGTTRWRTRQAFPGFFRDDPVFRYVLAGVGDIFMINYSSGGIGSEIIANRLGVGPMHDCLDSPTKSSSSPSTVGEVAQLVDIRRTSASRPAGPPRPAWRTSGRRRTSRSTRATRATCTTATPRLHQVPQHAHRQGAARLPPAQPPVAVQRRGRQRQLPRRPIGPSMGFTYEINFGGSGNRNKTAATRSSTATSTCTSRWACGTCGATTTCSRPAPSSR